MKIEPKYLLWYYHSQTVYIPLEDILIKSYNKIWHVIIVDWDLVQSYRLLRPGPCVVK